MKHLELDRRELVKGGALAGFALASPLTGLMATQAAANTNGNGEQTAPVPSPYGALAPVRDLNTGLFLLQLPRGFSYRSFSWLNDLMSDGNRVSGWHDGMAVVRVGGGRVKEHFLIRNHEERDAGRLVNVVGNPAAIYNGSTDADSKRRAGGCSVLRVRNGQLVDHRNTIGGTVTNCAGGNTLWNSWLTCEEDIRDINGVPHGYAFDVSSDPLQTVATPIKEMGRMPHEATASDPVTNYVYQTEDNRNANVLYRFKPTDNSRTYGSLGNGGTLQAAKVIGVDFANFIALAGPLPSTVAKVGESFQVEWIDVDQPDTPPTTYIEGVNNNPTPGASFGVSGPYAQARTDGAARFSRLEGIWYHDGVFYIADTSFGYDATLRPGRGFGSVWAYRPNRGDETKGTLTLVYASKNINAGNNPDNITVSPTGGVVFMEDGAPAAQRVMGLTPAGLAYELVRNNIVLSDADLAAIGRTGQLSAGDYRPAEFAGGCFSPDGRVFYVNVQTPGITFAIQGPWARGNL